MDCLLLKTGLTAYIFLSEKEERLAREKEEEEKKPPEKKVGPSRTCIEFSDFLNYCFNDCY